MKATSGNNRKATDLTNGVPKQLKCAKFRLPCLSTCKKHARRSGAFYYACFTSKVV